MFIQRVIPTYVSRRYPDSLPKWNRHLPVSSRLLLLYFLFISMNNVNNLLPEAEIIIFDSFFFFPTFSHQVLLVLLHISPVHAFSIPPTIRQQPPSAPSNFNTLLLTGLSASCAYTSVRQTFKRQPKIFSPSKTQLIFFR